MIKSEAAPKRSAALVTQHGVEVSTRTPELGELDTAAGFFRPSTVAL